MVWFRYCFLASSSFTGCRVHCGLWARWSGLVCCSAASHGYSANGSAVSLMEEKKREERSNMRIVRTQDILRAIGILIVLLLFQLPLAAYVTRPESQQLTQLLTDASDEALELASDAEKTETLILNDTNWVTHALMLARVKGHVDNMALIIEKLSRTQKSGSELQEQAVERMLPLMKELSANTTAAIN